MARFRAAGTVGGGSTSVTPGSPAGMANGDVVFIQVVAKAATAIVTPTGWTLGDIIGPVGAGSVGNGTGPTWCATYYRVKDAGWSAMPAITVTGGNSAAAMAFCYQPDSDANATYSIAATDGTYLGTTAGTAVSQAAASDPGFLPDDLALVFMSNQDEGPTWSAQAITATGITWDATATERSEAVEDITGNDVGGMMFDRKVRSGVSSAAPVVAATASAASTGGMVVVRLREASALTPTKRTTFDGVAEATQITSANTATGSGTPLVSAAGAGTIAAMSEAASAGLRGARASILTGSNRILDLSPAAGASILSASIYFKLRAVPSSNHKFLDIRTGAAALLSVTCDTTGALFFQDQSGGGAELTTATLTLGAWYKVSVAMDRGTTTSNGKMRVWVRDAVTDAFIAGYSSDVANFTGTTDASVVQFGKTSTTGGIDCDFDEIAITTGVLGEIASVLPVTMFVSPDGEATEEAFGSPTITIGSAGTTVSPTAIASGEAIGSPTVSTAITCSPGGIASAEAFGTATVTPVITVSPTAIASVEVFGTAVITRNVTVSPTAIASVEVFGTAVIGGTVTLSPTAIASVEVFGTPVLTPVITVSPGGVASAEAHGSPVISAGSGGTTVVPTAIASAETFGTTAVSATISVSPTAIASVEVFGTPVITRNVTVSPTAIASVEVFGTAVITRDVTVAPTAIASVEVFGTAVITRNVTVSPTAISTAEAIGTVAIGSGGITPTKTTTFDGVAENTNITAANTATGSGSPLSAASGASTVPALAAAAVAGARGARFNILSGGVRWFELNPSSAQTIISARAYVRMNALPSANHKFMSMRNSGGQELFACTMTATGTMFFQDQSGGGAELTTGVLTEDIWYQVSIAMDRGTSTSNGRMRVWLRTLDGTLVSSLVKDNANFLGTTDCDLVYFGKTASTGDVNVDIDEIAILEGQLAEIDPINQATTVSPTGIASAQAFGTHVATQGSVSSPTSITSLEIFGTPSVNAIVPTKTTTFDGVAEGTGITVATTATGSGDPLSAASGGAIIPAMAVAAVAGARGAKFDVTTGNLKWFELNPTAAVQIISARLYMRVNGFPSANHKFMTFRNSGGQELFACTMTSTGTIFFNDQSGGGAELTTGVMPVGEFLQISIAMDRGTTTANGKMRVWVRDIDGVLLASLTKDNSNFLGTTDCDVVQFGKTSSTGDIDVDIDEIAIAQGVLGEIAPVSTDVIYNISINDPVLIADTEFPQIYEVGFDINEPISIFDQVTVQLQRGLAPVAITSAEAFGTPTINAAQTVSPTGIASGQAFGFPGGLSQNVVNPTSILSGEIVGFVTIGGPGTEIGFTGWGIPI